MKVSKTAYVSEHYNHPVINVSFDNISEVNSLEKIVGDFLKENHFDVSDSGVVFFSSEIRNQKISEYVYSKCIDFVGKNKRFKTWKVGDDSNSSIFISFK